MWASNLHLPLCLSKKGTRPEFVNSERGGGGHQSRGVVVWRGGVLRKREEGGGGPQVPHRSRRQPAHCLVSREMSTFTVS